MEDGGEERCESTEPKRRRAGDIKDTFSICLPSRTKERLDKEVEEGRWGSRSQAISYYIHRGIDLEDHAREYANRQLLLLDELSRSDEEGTDMIHSFLMMMKKPKFRQLMKEIDESLARKK
jgi:Arc/MetJ-type ribon-helix-helix transcriptional regulator